MKLWSIALLAFLVGPGANAQPAPPMQPADELLTVPSVDVARYMGVWFEIAKYPNRFQKQCIADTQAHYRLLRSGTVEVVNRCKKENGEMEEAVGEARQTGAATSPKLQVRFAPSWLSFLPFVWGDYWVIDLDDRYQLVAVSEPKREFLWVLARTPTVSAESYDALMSRLKAQGFDLARLQRTKQWQ